MTLPLIFPSTPALNYATRSPRLYEAALMSSRSIISSPDLKAERSRNAEIGFNYHWNSALTLSGSYFHQQIKDVQAIRQAGKNYVWFNGGKLKNRGYELNAAYRWKGLTARAGVAYSRPKLNGDTADIVTTAIPMGRTWDNRSVLPIRQSESGNRLARTLCPKCRLCTDLAWL